MTGDWLPLRRLEAPFFLHLNEPPSKLVAEMLARIEDGDSPVVKIREYMVVSTRENKIVWEAYLRLHLSYVPVEQVQ